MATNRKEKRDEYNGVSSGIIQKEICDLRYSIGKSCRDCEFCNNCTYIRRKAWEIEQKRQVFEINQGCVRSE